MAARIQRRHRRIRPHQRISLPDLSVIRRHSSLPERLTRPTHIMPISLPFCLYIHSTLNPAVQSPHVPWLLVLVYSALVGETHEDEAAPAEADTFWVFEALEGRKRKLSERIKWADGELATSFVRCFFLFFRDCASTP
jgi:hypothetical protein